MKSVPMLLGISLVALSLNGCVDLNGLFGRDQAAATAPAAVKEARHENRPALPEGGKPAVTPASVSSLPAAAPVPSAHPAVPLPGITRLAPAAIVPSSTAQYRNVLLTEDTTWRGEVQVEGAVTIAPQTTLTIEPGTVIRFRRTVAGAAAGPLLLVEGRLVARGTAEAPVRFTSVFPDPQAGEWRGIVLLGSGKNNSLEYCQIEGASAGIDAAFSTVTVMRSDFASCGSGCRFQDCLVTMEGGSVSASARGLELHDSEATVRQVRIRSNGKGIAATESSLQLEGLTIVANRETGIVADGSRLNLAECTVEQNGDGLVLTDCQGMVTGGRIAGNRRNGVMLVRSRVRLTGNLLTGNAVGLRVADGKGIAWGNVFSGNERYDIYNDGPEEFRAIANWWEAADGKVGSRIFDQRMDAGRGPVVADPPLAAKPELPAMNSVAK